MSMAFLVEDRSGGSLSVLNVGEGDINITFNRDNPAERDQAITMLQDMQRRGYAIMIRLPDNTYIRAQSIDAEQGAYVVMLPEEVTQEDDTMVATASAPSAITPTAAAKRSPGRPRKTLLPIAKTEAVGIARSAGG